MEGNVEKRLERLESFVMVLDNKFSKLATEMAGVRHEICQLDEKLELVLAPPQVRKTKQVAKGNKKTSKKRFAPRFAAAKSVKTTLTKRLRKAAVAAAVSETSFIPLVEHLAQKMPCQDETSFTLLKEEELEPTSGSEDEDVQFANGNKKTPKNHFAYRIAKRLLKAVADKMPCQDETSYIPLDKYEEPTSVLAKGNNKKKKKGVVSWLKTGISKTARAAYKSP
ncbi:hypothetical protein CYMTET_44141 [Cymbomonas tetramitiformis]|uniref:Uncharacterized protein n=1 Tax=Cymbomonas tetramitiformis TaxID=36881 RepID=A0AAE0C2I0_9CHLO|nr:hypothetical protein CYMTET_44141 [Cymbomonas tetramitiformis]